MRSQRLLTALSPILLSRAAPELFFTLFLRNFNPLHCQVGDFCMVVLTFCFILHPNFLDYIFKNQVDNHIFQPSKPPISWIWHDLTWSKQTTKGLSDFTVFLRPQAHQVWFNQLMVFANFVLTTICYPGLITAIPCRQMQALAGAEWFQTLLLTIFTLFDAGAEHGSRCFWCLFLWEL